MRTLSVSLAALVVLAGCQQPVKRLNAPPHGESENVSDLRTTYEHMIDNALLADMSVSDVHFLPHRATLSALGEERLCRLTAILELYGGTVRLNLASPDEALNAARAATVKNFLERAGLAVTTDTVRPDLPGGAGLRAEEGVVILKAAAPRTKSRSGTDGDQAAPAR